MSQDVNDVQVGEGEDVKVKIEDPDEILVVTVIQKKKTKSATGSQEGDSKGGSGSQPPFTDNPEQRRSAKLERINECRRLRIARETPEQRKERLRKANERTRLSRANQTPEQKRAILDKEIERRRLQRERETSEERRLRNDIHNIRRKLQMAKALSEEERAKWNQVQEGKEGTRRRERQRKCEIKWTHLTDEELGEEVKQILIERRDKWKHKVAWEESPDGKLLMSRADMQRIKANYQKFISRKKKMTEEELARAKEVTLFRQFVRRAHMSEEEKQRLKLREFINSHAKMASMSKDEREQVLQKRREMRKLRMSNWTEEQKQRHKENVRKAIRRYQKNGDKFKKWHQERIKNQTPEQRQQTLLYYRINQAKRLLKKKLEKAGVAPDNIKEQIDQLVVRMRSEPLPPPSKYKPQRRNRNNPRKATETMESSQMDARARTTIVDVHNIIHEQAPSSSTPKSSFHQQGSQERVDPISNHGTEESRLDNLEYFCGTDDDPPSPPTGSPLPPQSISEMSPAGADDDESSEQEQNLQVESIFSTTIDTEQTAVPQEPIEPQPHSPLPSSSSPLLIQSPSVDTQRTPQVVSASSSSIKCPHCPSSFPEITELHLHLRSSHPEKCWKCPKCFAVVLSPQELAEHFKSHQTSSKALAKHEDLKEPSREPNQNKRPGRRKTAPAPVKTFPFSCMKCPTRSRSYKSTRFETHEKLTQHVRVAHPKSFFPCLQCKLLKYNSSSLEIHLKICTKKLKS